MGINPLEEIQKTLSDLSSLHLPDMDRSREEKTEQKIYVCSA